MRGHASLGPVALAVMSNIVKLVDALAWPVVALVALGVLVSPPGRQFLERLLGRVSRFKAGGVEVELKADVAREVKGNLQATFRAFREGATKAFDAQVHVERIVGCVERVAQDSIKPALREAQNSFRATIYVPDILFEDVLYRLISYYPSGGGRGTTYSARFGIIGKTWRLQRSECVSVPADQDRLIEEWGMTIAEATRQQRAKTFACIILREGDESPVGLLFVESEANDAFVDDVVDRLEESPSVLALTRAVGRVTQRVREAGQPPLKIFDE